MNRPLPVALKALCCSLLLSSCQEPTETVRLVPHSQDTRLPAQKTTTDVDRSHDASTTDTLQKICQEFSSALSERLADQSANIAVLPLLDDHGRTTGCSSYLADQLLAALLQQSLQVADRQSLKASLTEIDLASVFENPKALPHIAAIDVLIVGRYALVGGYLEMDLKAVEVRTNNLLLLESTAARADRRVRRLALSSAESVGESEQTSVEEHGNMLRVRASYGEDGADTLRLLDRVRQRIRRTLAGYLRDGLGCEVSMEELESIYRRGSEIDCEFRSNIVTLEMQFGVEECRIN